MFNSVEPNLNFLVANLTSCIQMLGSGVIISRVENVSSVNRNLELQRRLNVVF